MITQEALKEAGFKKFTQKNLWQYTDAGWQLCVRDKEGNKKYYITVAEYKATTPLVPSYDNSKYPDLMKALRGAYSYQPEGQFETEDGITFNIEMLVHNETVQDVLDFFERMYYRMNCKDYD